MAECTQPVIKHTLFLGCSIVSFNSNGGLNEQPTELNCVVVQDECPAPVDGPKYYYDTELNEHTTLLPDPGFIGEIAPIVGCPAYFRFGNFEFCGLIASWEKENSSSAQNVYSIKLLSPSKILQETNLIVGEYSGPLKPNVLFSDAPHNLINVYGFAEKVGGVSCPLISQVSPGVYGPGDVGIDGAVFGTLAGGFGGAGVNHNGMQWSLIKDIFSVLTSAVPLLSNEWSPHGRITHKGVNLSAYGAPWTNGYGLLPSDGAINGLAVSHYYVDLTEVPAVPSYFRFAGPTIGLLEAVSRVMQESGYDYYIELLPVKEFIASSNGVAKIIKIRVISRLSQPSFGQIQEYIDSLADDNVLVGSSVGRELRDDTTSTFLIGGPKQTVYQAYQHYEPDGDGQPNPEEADDMILPYFGLDNSGNMIVPYRVTGIWGRGITGTYWEFEVDTTDVNLGLQELQLFNPLVINEAELLEATNMASWEAYISSHLTESYQSISGELPESEMDLRDVYDMMDWMRPRYRAFASRDLMSWSMAYSDLQDEVLVRRTQDKDKIFQFISNLLNEYYGKKFSVRVPYTSVVQDPESLVKTFSEQPTNDGGWTEETGIIGLPNGSAFTDFFTNEQNKLTAFARFNYASGLDLSNFSPEDYIIYAGDLYLRADVEEQYVFHDQANYLYPRVVLSISNLVWDSADSEEAMYSRIHAALKAASTVPWSPGNLEYIDTFSRMYKDVAGASIFNDYCRRAYSPDAVAFGILSNVNNYGPWSTVGPAGGIRVEKNDGLVPWEYGNYATLNIAAQALADAGITNAQVMELGSITVAGYPELPLGGEINSSSALQNKHLVENRTPSYNAYNGTFIGGSPFTYQYLNYNFGFTWNGAYGPNVTNISVQGDANITTTYNMRTYTPQFGRFAELNASRLKQIGQNRMKVERDIRYRQFKYNQINQPINNNWNSETIFRHVEAQAKANRKALQGNTPHEVLVGQILPWESGQRAIIATESIREAIGELNTGTYERKAMMSLDGLIRPISLNGRGGLPRFVNTTGTGMVNSSQMYLVNTGLQVVGLSTGVSSVLITNRDLNPFTNPTGYAWSELASRHTGTKGHDIDILGRGTGIPSGGMILRHKTSGTAFDYRDDYSSFALRGPLVIAGWGYTTDGKPIPNEADSITGASSGVFKTSGVTNNFMADFAQLSACWPVGPVDLRFDIGRGVWTASNNEPEIYGQLTYHLDKYAPVQVLLLESGTYFRNSGTSGTITGYTSISGWTHTENLYASGTKLNFKYSTKYNRWQVDGDSEVTILITGLVNGGTWDSSVTGMKPYVFKAPTFNLYRHSGGIGSGWLMYNTGNMVTGWNMYTQALEPDSGKGYIAKLTNGWLDVSDCEEITI